MVIAESPTAATQQSSQHQTRAHDRRRMHPRAKSKNCVKTRNCSPHRNQQYSVIALTDGGGTITERCAYTAYGTPTITDAGGTVLTSSADNNRYTYTGREWDSELSLYHYRARMYDSVAGRFCSRDPIRYADGMSLYNGYFVPHSVDPHGLLAPVIAPGPPMVISISISVANHVGQTIVKPALIDVFVHKLGPDLSPIPPIDDNDPRHPDFDPDATTDPESDPKDPSEPKDPDESNDDNCLCCEIDPCSGLNAGGSGRGGPTWGNCSVSNAAACNARYPEAACAPEGTKDGDPVEGGDPNHPRM